MKLQSLVLALGLAACGSVNAHVTELPLQMDANGHIRVPVAVGNAGTFDFILDTAASRTTVMRPLVDELGWQPLEDEGAVVNGMAGASQIDLFAPVEFRVNGSVPFTPDLLPALNALEIPGDPFYGILGSNFFETYAVEIDAPGERLRLSADAAALVLDTDYSVSPLQELVDGIWALEVMVGDQPVTALLDTGARGSVLNRAAAEALGVNLPPAPEGGEEISGAAGHAMSGIGLQVGRIAAGARVWENAQVLVSDLHVFDVLEMADQPAMILASDLLFQGSLVIDYAGGEVLIELPE